MPETFVYTSPDGEQDQIAVRGLPYGGWPVRADASLTELEREWIAATEAQVGRIAAQRDRRAVSRAVTTAGLEKATHR